MSDKTTRPSTLFLRLWQQLTILDPEMPEEEFCRYAEAWAKIRDMERMGRTLKLCGHCDPAGEPGEPGITFDCPSLPIPGTEQTGDS